MNSFVVKMVLAVLGIVMGGFEVASSVGDLTDAIKEKKAEENEETKETENKES